MKSLVTFKARLIYAAVVTFIAVMLGFIATVTYVNQVDERRERDAEQVRRATCQLVQEMVREYDRIGTENAARIARVWENLAPLLKCEESK